MSQAAACSSSFCLVANAPIFRLAENRKNSCPMGVAGMSQAALALRVFVCSRRLTFSALRKNTKTPYIGRCGHGKRAPAECSDGGGKKQSHPAEGVAENLGFGARGRLPPPEMGRAFFSIKYNQKTCPHHMPRAILRLPWKF